MADEEVAEPLQVLPAEGKSDPVRDDEWILRQLEDLLQHYNAAMVPKRRRWSDIHRAHALVPEYRRSGEGPFHSNLTSELTRSYVEVAAARLTEGIVGIPDPWSIVEVRDDQADDVEQAKLLNDHARAIEQMLDGYARFEMDADTWLASLAERTTLLGDSVLMLSPTKDRKGQFCIKPVEVPLTDMTVWPMSEKRWSDLTVCGHTSRMTDAEWRTFAKKLKLDSETVEMVAKAGAEGISDDERKRLRDHQLQVGPSDSGLPCVTVYDWHVRLPMTRDGEAEEKHIIWTDSPKKLLWWSEWRFSRGERHPYYRFPYGPPKAAWNQGLGDEILNAQAATSTLWNMAIDNLLATGFAMKKIRQGSTAEQYMDRAAPGLNYLVDEPDDIQVEQLGTELRSIWECYEKAEAQAMRAGGITFFNMGTGDPILKSGADPSSIQMLLQESGRRFGKIEKAFRAAMTEVQWGIYQALMEYAPNGFYYSRMSPENAEIVESVRFQWLSTEIDQRRSFRLQVKAPSATTNTELRKQSLLIISKMIEEHLILVTNVGQQVWATQPETLRRITEQLLVAKHYVFAETLRMSDLPGIKKHLPEMEVTQQDEIIASLYQALEQMQQQFQQAMAQAQPQPQEPMAMGAPPPEQGVPGVA